MRTLTKILFILFSFFVFTVPSEAQEFLQKVESENIIGPNDTMCYIITNPNNLPMSFYPKVSYLPGGDYITYSEDSLRVWLLRQVTLPLQSEDAKLQMIDAIAHLIKSIRHVNRLGIYDHTDGTGHKKYSSIGWFSHYHAQCGDYMRYAYHLLNNVYGIPENELQEFSIDDQHTLGEIMLYGRWTKIDFDPGTPSLMTPNPASPNGFASIADIVADTGLLVEEDRYFYSDTLDLTPWFTMEEHRENFVGDTQSWSVGIEDDFEIDGTWTLCAGCKLEWITPVNNYLIYMDENSPEYQEGYGLFVQYQTTGDPSYYLQAISVLADYFGITNQEAQDIIEEGLLTVEEITLSHQLQERYDTIAPTAVLRIPATTEPLTIGRYGDVHLPFIVTEVETNGTVALLDTVIGQSGFAVELWNTDSAGLAEAYVVPNSELNFLNAGWVDSPNGETVITFAFNPNIYPIGQVDIGLHNVSFPNNLLVEADICNNNVDIVTSTNTEDSKEVEVGLLIYPNPTSGDFTVIMDGTSINNYNVLDVQGKKTQNENLSPGIYFIQLEHRNVLFVEKLIVR